MIDDLLIGISGGGVVHTDRDNPDLDTVFRMVKEAGVFDYIERSPPPLQVDEFRRLVDKHGVPLLAGRKVVRMRSVVDLPAPLRPKKPTSSPGAISNEMLSTAATGP